MESRLLLATLSAVALAALAAEGCVGSEPQVGAGTDAGKHGVSPNWRFTS